MSSAPLLIQRGEFISFFLFQCERISLPTSGRRLRPPRSILAHLADIESHLYSMFTDGDEPHSHNHPHVEDDEGMEPELVATMSPVRTSHGVELDLSVFYPGSPICVALFRALELFRPAQPTLGGHRLVLNIVSINLSQCGLDNASIRALCALLASGRCAVLETVHLDRNEYIAVEAGQMLLRMLGVRGALGDGVRGKSYEFGGAGGGSALQGEAASEGDPGTSDGALEASSTLVAAPLSLAESLPSIRCISLDGTCCPPHFIRRITALVSDHHLSSK